MYVQVWGNQLLENALAMIEPFLVSLVSRHDVRFDGNIMSIQHLVTEGVNDDSVASLAFRYSIAGCTEVQDLWRMLASFQRKHPVSRHAYLYIRQTVALDSRNASPVIEVDLPHATQISQQILDEFAVGYIPHLERPIRS